MQHMTAKWRIPPCLQADFTEVVLEAKCNSFTPLNIPTKYT
jgi:hypothetical protein